MPSPANVKFFPDSESFLKKLVKLFVLDAVASKAWE